MSADRGDGISPRDFGRLEAEVRSLQSQVTQLDKKVGQLLDLASRSKGALWAAMSVASLAGAIFATAAGWLIGWIKH